MEDLVNLQEILDDIDSKQFQEDESGDLFTISVDRLRAIVSTGQEYRKCFHESTGLSLPRYVAGDCVGIVGTDECFYVYQVSVAYHPAYEYTWHYRYGSSYFPEQDLELLGVRK